MCWKCPWQALIVAIVCFWWITEGMTAWYGGAGNLKRSNKMIVSHQWFLCPFAVDCVSCTKEQHRCLILGSHILCSYLRCQNHWGGTGCSWFLPSIPICRPPGQILWERCVKKKKNTLLPHVISFIMLIMPMWHVWRLLATSVLLLLLCQL